MGMVTSTGSVSGQSQIHIIDASHPMADGHSNGNVTIATTGTKVRWGFPTASADSIAEVAGQPTKSAIFAYQTGDSMNGLNAPHRRVGFFIDSTTPVDLNANGWGLFDAAVDWAINGGSSTFMPDPNQATAAAGAFKGNVAGKRGTSAKIQAISGSIQRISLSFAGGLVAVQVSGDPDPADNGLFHIYADHLGSSGSLSDSSGVYIPDSHAKYTPFGDWRTEPTATAGDRYYTNHKHNNLGNGADDLGLIYMNARYYLPGVGRFASADTVVQNFANPQTYNRFGYALNNPLRFTDPTGHRACSGPNDYGCVPDEYEDPGVTQVSGGMDDFWLIFSIVSMGSSKGVQAAGEALETAYECVTGGVGQCVATAALGRAVDFVGSVGGRAWTKLSSTVSDLVPQQLTNLSCGSACGSAMLRAKGINISEAEFLEIAGQPMEMDDLADILNSFDPDGNWVSGTLTSKDFTDTEIVDILTSDGTWFASMKLTGTSYQHMVLIDGYDELGRIRVHDPADGKLYFMTQEEFLQVWGGQGAIQTP